MIEDTLWTEKYRPTALDDVVGHERIIDRLRGFLPDESGTTLPHSIFSGRPGVGKTAAAVAYARQMYDGNDWKANFREFNASDDRGIDVVRDDIKSWTARSVSGPYPYKIIFLDEADQLTTDAQPALRRTMEQSSSNTRFILSCNYPNRIIDPIQSRCGVFRFSPLDDEEVEAVLRPIVEGEGIEVEDDALDHLVRSVRGDARAAVKTLQICVDDGVLEQEAVDVMTGVVDRQLIESIVDQALAGEMDDAMARLDVEVLKEGASTDALVDTFFRVVRNHGDLPPDSKVKVIDLLREVDEGVRAGLNPHVQFHALLGHIYMAPALSVYNQQGE